MQEMSAAETRIADLTREDQMKLMEVGARCRVYARAARENIYELGRELTAAKAICPRGEWSAWVEENAEISVREAQLYMAAWERFGQNDRVRALPKSAAFRLLPLPEDALNAFLTNNNVEGMTTREIERRVKAARDEAREEGVAQGRKEAEAAMMSAMKQMSDNADAEIRARKAAEARAKELAKRGDVSETVAQELREKNEEIRRYKAEVERLAVEGRKIQEDANRTRKEAAEAIRAKREQDEMLEELQEAYDRSREEIRSLESAQARGEAEKKGRDGELTGEAFRRAVQALITSCARAPYMEKQFARMDGDERAVYTEALTLVEKWSQGVRNAMRVWDAEGVVM